jgi:hypothetical protein
MRLFLDTEFIDLKPGANLISIALVDENEDFFYAEIIDTYTTADCSDFVKVNVLPYLKGDPYRMTWAKCAAEIKLWIEKRNVRCCIANDNPGWDTPYLKQMFKQVGFPQNLESMICPIFVPEKEAQNLYVSGNLNIHNALDDAIVMKRYIIDK